LASISLDDDDSFIEKLQLLVSSPSLRATLGAANRSWAVKHFNQELMLNRYVELFG
jgi:glycosyltransferase involved in cell wall biosynthesis